MFTDFDGDFYVDLDNIDGNVYVPESKESGLQADNPQEQNGWKMEGGEQIAIETVNKYLSEPTYTTFTPDRLCSEMMLFIPTPYESWNFEDSNYGLNIDQYALYDIDLDAWYEKH